MISEYATTSVGRYSTAERASRLWRPRAPARRIDRRSGLKRSNGLADANRRVALSHPSGPLVPIQSSARANAASRIVWDQTCRRCCFTRGCEITRAPRRSVTSGPTPLLSSSVGSTWTLPSLVAPSLPWTVGPPLCLAMATVAAGLRSISRLTICCQRNRLAAW